MTLVKISFGVPIDYQLLPSQGQLLFSCLSLFLRPWLSFVPIKAYKCWFVSVQLAGCQTGDPKYVLTEGGLQPICS